MDALERRFAIAAAARRAQNRKAAKKRHTRLREAMVCINGDGNPVHCGGRCEGCWALKLDGEVAPGCERCGTKVPRRVRCAICRRLICWPCADPPNIHGGVVWCRTQDNFGNPIAGHGCKEAASAP